MAQWHYSVRLEFHKWENKVRISFGPLVGSAAMVKEWTFSAHYQPFKMSHWARPFHKQIPAQFSLSWKAHSSQPSPQKPEWILYYTHTHTHTHISVFLIRSQSFQSHRFSLGIRVFDFSNRTHTNLLFSSVSSIATIFIFVMVSFFLSSW